MRQAIRKEVKKMMDITKKIREQLDELRTEYEIYIGDINEMWPGFGRMPTEEQMICNALQTELRSIRKLNRRYRGERRNKRNQRTVAAETIDVSGIIKEEERRLDLGSEEFLRRHEEIMDELDKIEERATDQSKRARK